MSDFLVQLGICLFFLSIAAFGIGFIMLFFENRRELGLKIILGSVVAFIIGFGSCVAAGNLN